jgi:hypothetical protein
VVLKERGFGLAVSLVRSPVYSITEYCEIETEFQLNYFGHLTSLVCCVPLLSVRVNYCVIRG